MSDPVVIDLTFDVLNRFCRGDFQLSSLPLVLVQKADYRNQSKEFFVIPTRAKRAAGKREKLRIRIEDSYRFQESLPAPVFVLDLINASLPHESSRGEVSPLQGVDTFCLLL